jgi:hypothetical protein
MGELVGHPQIMFALSFVGVRVAVGAGCELLVSQLTEDTPVREHGLTLDVGVGVFLAEAMSVFADSFSRFLKDRRANLPLAVSGDLVCVSQEPAQRGRDRKIRRLPYPCHWQCVYPRAWATQL